MSCLDARTCEASSGPVCDQPGHYMTKEQESDSLANCCCQPGGMIPSQACSNVTCPKNPDSGWPDKNCAGITDMKELQNCCMPLDLQRRGRVPQGYTDDEPYPEVCRGVNDNFKPDLPQLEPVGPGQPRDYCTDWDSGAWDETSKKYQDCKRWCKSEGTFYGGRDWKLNQLRCKKGPDAQPPAEERDDVSPPNSDALQADSGARKEAPKAPLPSPARRAPRVSPLPARRAPKASPPPSRQTHPAARWHPPKHHSPISGKFSYD